MFFSSHSLSFCLSGREVVGRRGQVNPGRLSSPLEWKPQDWGGFSALIAPDFSRSQRQNNWMKGKMAAAVINCSVPLTGKKSSSNFKGFKNNLECFLTCRSLGSTPEFGVNFRSFWRTWSKSCVLKTPNSKISYTTAPFFVDHQCSIKTKFLLRIFTASW